MVCEVARDFIAANGVADRVEAQACNFTRDPFPVDCDVAIMASNLPMYGRDMIASVIKKAHDALLPGGQMHLIGEMTNDERTVPGGRPIGAGPGGVDSLGLPTPRPTSSATSAPPASPMSACTTSSRARWPCHWHQGRLTCSTPSSAIFWASAIPILQGAM